MTKKRNIMLFLIFSVLCIFGLFGVHFSDKAAQAETNDDNKSIVEVAGEHFNEENTYYLEWSALSFVYSGNKHSPTAVLKCEEEETFEQETTVVVYKDDGSETAIDAVEAGTYRAVAICERMISGNEKTFVIHPLERAVRWDVNIFTFNGKPQCPVASYFDVYGSEIFLAVNGAQTDAGNYTATAEVTAAGGNYVLTQVTCEFTIEKYAAKILWDLTDYHIENENVQAPRAFYINAVGKLIEISVQCSEGKASEYVAQIDLSEIDPNVELTGKQAISYTITAKDPFGAIGLRYIITLGILLLISVTVAVAIIVVLIVKQKEAMARVKFEKVEKTKFVIRLQETERNLREQKLLNRSDNQYIEQLSDELENLRKQLKKADRKIKDNYAENIAVTASEVAELKEKIQALETENEHLVQQAQKREDTANSRGFERGYPIETYLPEIKSALADALTVEFDEQNAKIGFLKQRQQLNAIIRTLERYEKQRRN